MEHISIFVIVLFIAATCFTVWQFYKASANSKATLIGLIIWMSLQAIISLTGFYQKTQTMPPRFLFLLGPTLIIILVLFLTSKGRAFIDALDNKKLTLLHSVRVPVEITLYFLFLARLIPVLMTFEGYNYDILSGLTAPVIYYLAFVVNKADKKVLLMWNFSCLALLLNVVTIAVLSAKTPFQQLAFNQPNAGVTYFPFVWLPSIIVPLVLFSHLASIRQLLKS